MTSLQRSGPQIATARKAPLAARVWGTIEAINLVSTS